jgi:hypothetical protein
MKDHIVISRLDALEKRMKETGEAFQTASKGLEVLNERLDILEKGLAKLNVKKKK